MTTPYFAQPALRTAPNARMRPFSIFAVLSIVAALIVIAVTYLLLRETVDPTIAMYAAGALYALLVIALATLTPHYAFMLAFATAPFAWDVSGSGVVNMAVSEITLVLSVPFLLMRIPQSAWKRTANPLWIPILCYLAIATFSSMANGALADSAVAGLQMGLYLVLCIFVFSVALPNVRSIYPAFYGLLAATTFLALGTIVNLSPWILGLHKNLVGTELMYGVIIAFELWLAKSVQKAPRWLNALLFILLVAGLVISTSRGAWAGAVAGVLVILLLRRRFALAGKALLVLVPIIAIAWFLMPAEAKEYVTDVNTSSGSGGTRVISIQYAWGYFTSSPTAEIYGVGVWLRKYSDATNIVVFTLAETGIVGLIAFLSIFATLAGMAWSAQKRIARTDPVFSLLVIGTALVFAKLTHGLVDHFWSRGVVPVWAGAGLVIYAWVYSRRPQPPRPGQMIDATAKVIG